MFSSKHSVRAAVQHFNTLIESTSKTHTDSKTIGEKSKARIGTQGGGEHQHITEHCYWISKQRPTVQKKYLQLVRLWEQQNSACHSDISTKCTKYVNTSFKSTMTYSTKCRLSTDLHVMFTSPRSESRKITCLDPNPLFVLTNDVLGTEWRLLSLLLLHVVHQQARLRPYKSSYNFWPGEQEQGRVQ